MSEEKCMTCKTYEAMKYVEGLGYPPVEEVREHVEEGLDSEYAVWFFREFFCDHSIRKGAEKAMLDARLAGLEGLDVKTAWMDYGYALARSIRERIHKAFGDNLPSVN